MTTAITKFWALANAGKSAALDININTGELVVRCTVSATGAQGNGAAPATYGDDWARIVSSDRGQVSQGNER